jgi:hypothetical protein
MDRALPEYNKILHKKWQTYSKRIHKQRITETRPAIDNNEPSSFKYPIIKLKKEQILEGNICINLSNKFLFLK